MIRRIHQSTLAARDWLARQEALAQTYDAEGHSDRARAVRKLDVLEVKGTAEEGEDAQTLGRGVSVMEWTGPGVWTDAVMAFVLFPFLFRLDFLSVDYFVFGNRYLKARYDVPWPTLQHLQGIFFFFFLLLQSLLLCPKVC